MYLDFFVNAIEIILAYVSDLDDFASIDLLTRVDRRSDGLLLAVGAALAPLNKI